MSNGTDPIVYWIIGLGFVGGYFLVSFIMNKMKMGFSGWKSHETPEVPPPKPESPISNSAVAGPPPIRSFQPVSPDPEEQRFARVLNLDLPSTPSQVQEAYNLALAQYAPEKLANLAPEIQKLAAERRREIIAAYEFFQTRQSGQ
ncbi:MAG: hypothetical protein JWM16_4576 [Verrucomicrobiales bacterium]|nr:hypothetical protein [Verrucomicrobiales bacterium]